ncbi:MAG: hypothetical protein MZV70_50590 [Desulfobacterales bacterium]|nr:hypothetical protein [Desulfobacterales bacterium]
MGSGPAGGVRAAATSQGGPADAADHEKTSASAAHHLQCDVDGPLEHIRRGRGGGEVRP